MDRTDTLHFYFSNYTTECFVSVWKRIEGYYISLCLAEFLFLQYNTLRKSSLFPKREEQEKNKQTGACLKLAYALDK